MASIRVAQRRAYNNIWSDSKSSSRKKSSSSSKSSSSKDNGETVKSNTNGEGHSISYYRKKAVRASQAMAKNHPRYGKGKVHTQGGGSSYHRSSSDETNGSTSTSSASGHNSHQTRKARYYVSKNSKSGYGASKKGGAGGAFTWGAPGDEVDIPEMDPNDPNYDSEAEFTQDELEMLYPSEGKGNQNGRSEQNEASVYRSDRVPVEKPRMSLSDFKTAIIDVLGEFFVSEDMSEASYRIMDEIATPLFHWELVKRTITMAMDRKERSREAACRLLAYLHAENILTTRDIGQGYERLFEYMDDLEADVPFCKRYLAQFLARAVADEILPPSFLNDSYVQAYGAEVVDEARTLLSRKHGVARVEKVWGPGDGRPVSELKKEISMLLHEYLNCRVKAEAAHCLRSLNSPHFHHEFVKRLVVIAMDVSKESRSALLELCLFLFDEQILTTAQTLAGLGRLDLAIEDLALDSPHGPEVLQWFKDSFKQHGII
eukprot:g2756.t1